MLDIKAFPRHEIHKPPFPNSTLNRKMGIISTDIQQTLYPPCKGLGSASGIHQQLHTGLQAGGVPDVLESHVKRSCGEK